MFTTQQHLLCGFHAAQHNMVAGHMATGSSSQAAQRHITLQKAYPASRQQHLLHLRTCTHNHLCYTNLHTNECQICWRADQRTQATCSEAACRLLPQRQVFAVIGLLGDLSNLGEDAQAGRCVGGLAQQSCRQALVESTKAILGNDVLGNTQLRLGKDTRETEEWYGVLCVCQAVKGQVCSVKGHLDANIAAQKVHAGAVPILSSQVPVQLLLH
jgi:hypothetical protein